MFYSSRHLLNNKGPVCSDHFCDLLQIAHQFSIAVTAGSRKDEIKTGCGHWLEKQSLIDEDMGGKGSDSEGTVTEPIAVNEV